LTRHSDCPILARAVDKSPSVSSKPFPIPHVSFSGVGAGTTAGDTEDDGTCLLYPAGISPFFSFSISITF
jgi:hypothetical protein